MLKALHVITSTWCAMSVGPDTMTPAKGLAASDEANRAVSGAGELLLGSTCPAIHT